MDAARGAWLLLPGHACGELLQAACSACDGCTLAPANALSTSSLHCCLLQPFCRTRPARAPSSPGMPPSPALTSSAPSPLPSPPSRSCSRTQVGRWAGLHGCGLTRAKGLQCAAGCSTACHPPPLQLTQPRLTRPTPPADPEYAGACLHHARQLYTLATQVRNVVSLACCLPALAVQCRTETAALLTCFQPLITHAPTHPFTYSCPWPLLPATA